MQSALGTRVRDLYSDIYAINTNIHAASEDEIKGALSRVTGKDAKAVGRYYSTFKALCDLAEFDSLAINQAIQNKASDASNENGGERYTLDNHDKNGQSIAPALAGFHYNIQIHLPATTDISVYNAIFKSLKDTLNI
jgi:hypothetical protein